MQVNIHGASDILYIYGIDSPNL